MRGVGPDFNLVLLNGRQMPASTIQATVAAERARLRLREPRVGSDLRDRGLQDRPRRNADRRHRRDDQHQDGAPARQPGLRTSFGAKGVSTTVGDNLPDDLQGDDFTPEVSGIFSNTFGDDNSASR